MRSNYSGLRGAGKRKESCWNWELAREISYSNPGRSLSANGGGAYLRRKSSPRATVSYQGE